MRYLSSAIICCMLLFPLQTFAQVKYEKYMTPGARLLAGDTKRNEFFILASNDDRPKNKPLLHVNQGRKAVKRIRVVSEHFSFKPQLFSKNKQVRKPQAKVRRQQRHLAIKHDKKLPAHPSKRLPKMHHQTHFKTGHKPSHPAKMQSKAKIHAPIQGRLLASQKGREKLQG